MKKPRTIGIREVAKAAGVSLATVSNALRPGPRVPFISESTQQRVREVARRMGFRVNLAARRLRSARRYSVAIVCCDLRDQTALAAAESMVASLAMTPYVATVAPCGGVEDLHEHLLAHFDTRSHDAVILIRDDRRITPDLLRALSADGIRCAAILPERPARSPRIPIACLDRPAAVETMISELAALGHRAIDFVVPRDLEKTVDHMVAKTSRSHGVRARMLRPLIPDGREKFRTGYALGRGELSRSAATAVAAFSGRLAQGILEGLKDAGLSVPRDRSIVAYGSPRLAECSEPPLAHVCHPVADIGNDLMLQTVAWIESGYAPADAVVLRYRPAFHRAASVAPPAADRGP
jgi:DNA-binding LacI/PurR family transcriptional regulator